MKQKLETYLEENRQRMDVDQHEEAMIWQHVQEKLSKKSTSRKMLFRKIAAAVFVLLSITYIIYNESKPPNVVIVGLSDISPELARQETEYKKMLIQKTNEIKISPSQKEQLQFLYNELHELDTIYNSYLDDLNQSGANEQIIRSLLDYYEKKIRVLDRILNETQKMKDHENNEKYLKM